MKNYIKNSIQRREAIPENCVVPLDLIFNHTGRRPYPSGALHKFHLNEVLPMTNIW